MRIIGFALCVLFFWTSLAWSLTLDQEHFKGLFFREISKSLPWGRDKLTLVRFHAEPQEIQVPAGYREVPRFRQPPRVGSNTMLVDYFLGDRLVGRVRLLGFVEVMLPVVVLKHPLARHNLIHQEDLGLEKRPLSRLPKDVFTKREEAVGLRTRMSLRAGQVLRRSQVEEVPLIKRGRLVRIVAEGPGFIVTAVGEARQDGRLGEIIKVRNLKSKREIFARVVDAETVKVTF